MAKKWFIPVTNDTEGLEIVRLNKPIYAVVYDEGVADNGEVYTFPRFIKEQPVSGFAMIARWSHEAPTVVRLSVTDFKLLAQALIGCEHDQVVFSSGFSIGPINFYPVTQGNCFNFFRPGEMRIFFPRHPRHDCDLITVRTSILRNRILGPRPTGPTGRVFFEALRPGRSMSVYQDGERVGQLIITSYPFFGSQSGHWRVRGIFSSGGGSNFISGMPYLDAHGITPYPDGSWSSRTYCIAD